VDRVSSTDVSAGEQHAIMSAIEDPPRLSISSLVSFESLGSRERMFQHFCHAFVDHRSICRTHA
jgi:hypothetical protein